MAKKKQADFQKTKLRVGKTLPRGLNVTDTSFKTRKIVTRDQQKGIPGNLSLKELLNYLGQNNVSTKKDTLNKLNNYVLERKDTLNLFFMDILKKVGGTLLEDDGSVREVAINVLHNCLRHLTDSQINCFFTVLSLHLNCMMTHKNKAIQKDSLKFLDKILNSHPNVICHSVKVLSSLLSLISSVVHGKKGRKRKLDEIISSRFTSQDWRVDVLRRVYNFLQCALGTEDVYENESEDEHEVYWDAEKPLYLPLYLRGGTTPVPLESLNGDSNLTSTNSKELKAFIYDLVPLLSETITGEIPYKLSADDDKYSGKILERSVINHLNMVVQVLCCVGEWLRYKSNFETILPLKILPYEKDDEEVEDPQKIDEEFNKLLHNIICRQLYICFPYAQHDSFTRPDNRKRDERKSGSDSMQLNLGFCYLYCLFILDSDLEPDEIKIKVLDKMKRKMFLYLESALRVLPGALCNKSMQLMLKISKICITSTNVNTTVKNGILLGLYGILEPHKLSPCARPIYSFFMDVSLNYDLKCLLNSEGMTTWFKGIQKEMAYMMGSHSVNKKFLKYIRQICSRRYAYFMECLNKAEHQGLLDFLKYDDEEFQLTTIHLICALNNPCDLLQDLMDLINDPSFSLKTATRLIHLLHSRFLGQDVHGKEKLLFLQFLLNLGCDTPVLIDPSWESNETCSETLRTVLESCQYELHPSLKWERHLKITKVCFDCLPTYMQIEPLTESSVMFIKTILLEHSKLPIHCAIALLKLRKKAFDIYQDEHLGGFYGELIFSSLMYLSVMHMDDNKEDLEPYAISELQKCLQLERSDVPEIINIINSNVYNFGENELYHALRLTFFLIESKILQIDDRNSFYSVLEKVNSTCTRSKLLHPLYVNICKFFLFM